MRKAPRAAFNYACITLQQISKIIKRGHLVAFFILLTVLAMIFVGKAPSAANSSGRKSTNAWKFSSVESIVRGFSPKDRLPAAKATEDPQTLTTDKATYLPGETITFAGANWTAGEVVTIVISPAPDNEGTTIQATADDSGSFTVTTVMPDAPSATRQSAAAKSTSATNATTSDEAGVYTATATGANSGATAHAQFSLREGEEADGDDPDLPAFMVGKVDKEDYLRRREEHINKLRGIVHGRPFDPSWRGQAIRELNRQEGKPDRTAGAVNSGASSSAGSGAGLSAPSTPSSSTVWSNIGPNPLPNGQTFNTNNVPVSGRVTAIAIHPTNSNIAYVGAAQGGVYRTLDGGATWTPIFDSAQSLAVGAIAIAPSQPSTIYVGTGEENFSCDSYFGVGVYRIDNADGASPTLSGPFNKDGTGIDQMSGRAIGKILVHPTNPGIIFVGTGGGIGGVACVNIPGVDSSATSLRPRGLWRSSNATAANPTFDRMTLATDNGGNRNVTDIEFEPGNSNILFATVLGFSTVGSGGVWYSTNPYAASPTFTRTLAASSTSTSERFEISLNKTGGTVYIMTATSQASGTFKRGTYTAGSPAGASWSGALGTSGFCGGQCTYDMPIAVDPNNANVVYLGGPGDGSPAHILTKVTNATATPTFTASQTGIHADEHAIEIDPNNTSILWTGNDGGIFKSTNAAASWNSLNGNGFVATQFQSLAVHSTDANFTIGGTQDNGTECLGPCGTFTGNTWNQADYGDGGFALIDQSQSSLTTLNMYHTYYNQTNTLIGYAYVVNTANAKFASSPIGNSWSFIGTGGSVSCTGGGGYACTEAVEFYMPMALGPGSPNPIYTGTDRLHRAATPGASNATVSQAPIVSGIPISAIGISPQSDLVRIVGLENGQVWRTMTGSSTLVNVTGTIPAGYISRAVIDPTNQNTAYVTLSAYFGSSASHIYKTNNLNAGTPTWSGVDGGQIPDIPINAFVVDPSNSSFLYAGTDIGVYRSTDGGTTWTTFSNGLPRVAVFDMAIQNSNHILRIATHGRGLWEISIGTTGNLQGTITDATTSNPLNGATVTAGSNTTITNPSGFYQFTAIPTGTYSVTASAAGYTSNTVAGVVVNDSATTTQNIALTPAPTSGCFTDTSQADFQAGTASNLDLTTNPGSVVLASGAAALDQSQQSAASFGFSLGPNWVGQTFTPAITGKLAEVDVHMFNNGGVAGNVVVEIRTTSGGLPTNTILATTTIAGSTVGSDGNFPVLFSSPASLNSGTLYAFTLRMSSGSGNGATRSSNNAYANGAAVVSTNSGGTWSAQSQDLVFQTFMSTGFAASGDLTSSVKDSNPAVGSTPNWTTLSWTASTPANTAVKFQAAGSNSSSGPFNFVGPDGTAATSFTTSGASLSQFNGFRYLKYKAYLSTTNSSATPTLNDVTVCFNVVGAQAATSLAVSAASGTYGGTANLSATLTSSGNPVSGKTISFTLNGNSAGSAVTNASGLATLSNASLSGINAGSYPSGVGASFAGDASYLTSSGSNSLTIAKAASTTTVTCGPGPFTYDGTAKTPCTATVTGAGGLNQALTVSYSNNTNAGTATASASYAGDANHDASADSKNFTIGKASSTTTVTCGAGPLTYDGTAKTPCTATVTGAGGLNQSLTVSYANNTNAGTASASASYPGDSNHDGSADSKNFTIGKASSTTTIDCTAGAPFTYTGSAITPCTATATGAGGLNVSVTPVNYANNVNAGAATASATYGGDANHDSSTGNGGFTINKASSTTTVDCTTGAPFTYTGSAITPCTATATGAGGLNISVTPVNYANNVNAGAATASATYGGDANHDGSTGNGGFTINKASSTTTIDCTAGAPFTYSGSAITPCTATATGAGGLNVSVTPVNYANNVNAGAATASATYGGDANHDGSTGNGGFTIDKATSSVTVNCPASETYTGAAIEPCTASFSGAGGLSGSLTPTYMNNINVGIATASASYAGDSNHDGSNNSANFAITKASSSVTVSCPASETYTGAAIEPCTASFSGAGGLSGSLTPTYMNNINVGTATASASYAGDANHDGSNNTANFAIQQASSTTTVTVTDATYDGSEHGGTASVTGAGGLSQSLDVTYTGRNGTIYGPTTTRPTNAGDYTASATFAGDNNHTGSSDSKNFTINKANATISVASYSVTYDGNPHTATGTARDVNGDNLSGLDLSGTTHTDAGTYNGDPWTFTDVTGNYNNANGAVNDAIGQAGSTTAVSVSNATFDGSPHGGTANVTGAGGLNQNLTVSYNGRNGTVYGPTPIAPANAGDYTASASFAGDANHNGSSDSQNFTIAKANQTISFGTISPMTFGDGDFNVTATATSGLTVSLAAAGQCSLSSSTSPATVHIAGAGNCVITASQGGNGNYNAADNVVRSFDIAKANQIINFAALGNKTYGDADFLVSATASSQLAVSFAANGNCSVSGSTVHITGAGSCTITASQLGDANYNPAPDVSRTFSIAKASSTTTVTCPASVIYNGSAQTPCTAGVTGVGGLNQSLSVSYSNNTNAGTATASASYSGDANHTGSNDSKNFSIVSAASSTTVTSSKNPSAYGDVVSFTANVAPNTATGTVQFKIDGTDFGSLVAIVNGSATSGGTSSLTAGSHTISAVYSGDNNFAGSTANLTQIVARPVKITGGGSVGSAMHFGFNVKPVQDDTSARGFKGHVEFHDNGLAGSADDLKFKSTSISTEYAVDNHHGTFAGAGTLNGVSGYTFIATIEDNAKKGAGNDKFRLQIMNSANAMIYDSNTRSVNPDGTLIAGKIKIHYDKDDFNTSSLEGNGSFLSGSLNFDIDVETDGLGGYNSGAGVQFADSTNTYTLTSVSIDTMKIGGIVTVTGPALFNGVQGYRFQTDWDTGKLTLHLRVWDSAGKQIYDSKPNQLSSGSCAFISSN